MAFSISNLRQPLLFEERRIDCDCPECSRSGASKIVEIWEGEVLIRRGCPDTGGGYFGDHPWEYGEGYVDWERIKVDEVIGIECPHCTAGDLGEVFYEADNFSKVCSLFIPDLRQIHRELMEYFSRNPDKLYKLEPRKFEELLDAIFRNRGYKTDLGPGWGDRGIDLRLFQKDEIGEILTGRRNLGEGNKPSYRTRRCE